MGQQLGDRLVYVIDDDREIRLSLSFQLRTLGYAVFPFADAPAFLEAAGSLAPGCVLLDIRMPNMDGAQALVAMRRRGVTWPVVIMTGHAEVSIAVDVMKNGALDFLEKPFEDAELQAALRRGFERLDQQRVQSEASRHAADRLGRLTRREHDVLHLMLEGESNKAIAFKLDLSVRTVEMHRANALAKLEARNAAEAAAVVAAAPRSSRS